MVQRYGVGDAVEIRFDPDKLPTLKIPQESDIGGSVMIGRFGPLIWAFVAFIVFGLLAEKHKARR